LVVAAIDNLRTFHLKLPKKRQSAGEGCGCLRRVSFCNIVFMDDSRGRVERRSASGAIEEINSGAQMERDFFNPDRMSAGEVQYI
jgi:hypothetical protein